MVLSPEKPQLRSELSWGTGAGSAGLIQDYPGPPPSPRTPPAASRPAALWQASPQRQARFSHRLSALGQGQPKGDSRRQFSQESEAETSVAPGGMSLRIDASLAAGVQRGWRPCPACVLQAEAQNSHVPARAESGGRGGHPAHSPGSTARGPPRRRESGTVRAPQGPEGRALGLAPQPPPRAPARPSALHPGTRAPALARRPSRLSPSPGTVRGGCSSDATTPSGPGGPPPGSHDAQHSRFL